MGQSLTLIVILLVFAYEATSLIPPRFQWKTIDFAWGYGQKEAAIKNGMFIPENNLPTGLARWRDKLFITIPRWKKGVTSSLNYVWLNGTQQEPLHPYPNWDEGTGDCCTSSNRTVISTFRVHIDQYNRLWVVDNAAIDMSGNAVQLAPPSLLVFDLETDELLLKHVFKDNVLRDTSVFTNIVVEILPTKKGSPESAFAYIPDMGSNAILVYDLANNDAWRVENPYFHFDPHAGRYKVGGIEFYWRDGVSSAALSNRNKDGFSDLYLHPTSSTKLFKMSTKLLRNKTASAEDILNGVEIVGDRGPMSQSTACDIDPKTNTLFYTQICQNGLGCWNLDKPFSTENSPVIFSDCNLMEFPNDVKIDSEGNVWMLSDRQSRFLYEAMNFDDVNFRVLTASANLLIQDTACSKKGARNVTAKKSNTKL